MRYSGEWQIAPHERRDFWYNATESMCFDMVCFSLVPWFDAFGGRAPALPPRTKGGYDTEFGAIMEVNATPLPGEGGWRNPPTSILPPVSSTQRKYHFAFTSGSSGKIRDKGVITFVVARAGRI